MDLPLYIETALRILSEHSAEGWCVGGCVRDALMGRTPGDYDIAVNIPPAGTERCFAGYKLIETGLQHGTVVVVIDGHNVEITSFRTDGDYTDLRHPENVAFTPRLETDLARRDFTINAMAYAPERGLVDLFGGQEDLKAGLLRCVGDPDRRFNEDALRILRALRFAATLDFAIEEQTARSVKKNAANLTHISAERIFAELKKLLAGKNALRVLLDYRDVLTFCLPQLDHIPQDAYAAAARTAAALRDPALSFAALLFPAGETAAEAVCRALKTDNRFRQDVCFLIRHRDTRFVTVGEARRFLGEHGKTRCEKLLRFCGETPDGLLAEVCIEPDGNCRTLADLAVNGRALQAIGFRGEAIGDALNELLRRAAEGEIKNEPTALLAAARGLLKETE